ncbi:hypothetical protein B0H13DRAFT_1881241 [Mycena leptocephala]|nr:hypothetical protein B0H13DRAFT_1881241 [Mycena leptocephala]
MVLQTLSAAYAHFPTEYTVPVVTTLLAALILLVTRRLSQTKERDMHARVVAAHAGVRGKSARASKKARKRQVKADSKDQKAAEAKLAEAEAEAEAREEEEAELLRKGEEWGEEWGEVVGWAGSWF